MFFKKILRGKYCMKKMFTRKVEKPQGIKGPQKKGRKCDICGALIKKKRRNKPCPNCGDPRHK